MATFPSRLYSPSSWKKSTEKRGKTKYILISSVKLQYGSKTKVWGVPQSLHFSIQTGNLLWFDMTSTLIWQELYSDLLEFYCGWQSTGYWNPHRVISCSGSGVGNHHKIHTKFRLCSLLATWVNLGVPQLSNLSDKDNKRIMRIKEERVGKRPTCVKNSTSVRNYY